MTEEHKKRESRHAAEAQASTPKAQAATGGEEESTTIESLSAELEKTRDQSKEYFEGWQRERADFTNYKKRIERDQIQMAQAVNGTIIKKYLVVMDDLEGSGVGIVDGDLFGGQRVFDQFVFDAFIGQ